MPVIIPRFSWPPDFPDVIVHSNLAARKAHRSYAAAKAGDPRAAKAMVEDLLAGECIDQLAALVGGRHPLLLAVTADEVSGFNAIPDAMAQALAASLGFTAAAGSVVQANKVGHTKAGGWHRLVTPALFTGEIVAGADYLLVDDHVGFGGTLANLRGFIEQNGARVIGMTTLTETREARRIAIRNSTANRLKAKHGQELEDFWREEFGHGIDCLTEIEAGYICRAESVAAIQNRMAEAAELARSGGLSPVEFGLNPSP